MSGNPKVQMQPEKNTAENMPSVVCFSVDIVATIYQEEPGTQIQSIRN